MSVDTAKDNLAKAGNWEKHKGHKYYGRFNEGVVTLNLVDVALSANKDVDKFWKLMEERSELVHEALQIRHNRLLGTKSDVAPILWQHGALARLEKGETIDKLLNDAYSTISFGYGGVYECCKAMLGVSHTTEKGQEFAMQILRFMTDKCNEWKEKEHIGYSVYGSPMESTTYKFAKCLRKRFGVIKDITDHDYITNSFHVNVRENISAFDKLEIESKFQELSTGGLISYVEIPNMTHNIRALVQLLQYMYDNIMYAEINTKSDYCQKCGYDGEILIKGEQGNLYWECPNCGNRNKNTLNVCRRTCGYLGSNFFNQGRTEEIKDRVLHLDDN
nr:anaerobic ribonucleoside-triphosphate reductase [Veillonella montpellierensis]